MLKYSEHSEVVKNSLLSLLFNYSYSPCSDTKKFGLFSERFFLSRFKKSIIISLYLLDNEVRRLQKKEKKIIQGIPAGEIDVFILSI